MKLRKPSSIRRIRASAGLTLAAFALTSCNFSGEKNPLGKDSVSSDKIADETVGASDLAPGSVTATKLDPRINIVTTGSITAGGTIASTGNLSVNTNMFNVTAASGNVSNAGTLTVGTSATVGSSLSVGTNLGVSGTTTLADAITHTRTSTTGGALGTVSGMASTFTFTPSAAVTTGTIFGNNTLLDYTGASGANSGSTLVIGAGGELDHDGSGTLESAVGMRGSLLNKSTGTITVGTGLQARAYNSSSAIAGTLRAVFADAQAQGTGAITNASALDATLANTGTGVITNGFGIRISSTGVNAIMTNYVGLKISDPGRTANTTATYGIFSDGSTFNYFAGRVGIGNTSPTVPLDVTGAGNFTGALTVSGAGSFASTLGVTGAVTLTNTAATAGAGTNPVCIDNATGVLTRSVNGAGCQTTSDSRLKDRVETIQGALEKVLSLTGVTYFWKDKKRGSEKHVGLLAQDVQKTFPELVGTDSKGFLGVDYQGLIAPLVQAVKELHGKWNSDHEQLAKLREQNEKLLARLDKLERTVAMAPRACPPAKKLAAK